MDKFVVIRGTKRNISDCNNISESEPQPPEEDAIVSTPSASKTAKTMRAYKDNLVYNPTWKNEYTWMDYDSSQNGMVCTICNVHGKPPVQARGAWVTRPINNWVKAKSLLIQHETSDWHAAAIERMVMSQSTEEHGNVMEQLGAATVEEKKQNRDIMKKLIRSLYFLVKHHIPHTTTFKDLITLQIENGGIILKSHRENCPHNATYESYTTIVELLSSISNVLEKRIITSLSASPYYSLMADESTDVASQEELSVCIRWIEDNKPVEHFLGILHAKEKNAQAIACYLRTFLQSKNIGFDKMRGLGFDGTNTMSGHRSGVQIRLRLHAPSSIYVHCRCHKLQLAALNAASEHTVVKRVLGTLLTIWKAFHFSPKKAEKLAEIQAELQASEIKMQKPSDTRWLARERAVSAVRRSLPALVSTFEEIYAETGDAHMELQLS